MEEWNNGMPDKKFVFPIFQDSTIPVFYCYPLRSPRALRLICLTEDLPVPDLGYLDFDLLMDAFIISREENGNIIG